MLTIRPVTPMHVPLQPLFIPCTWHTKSLLLYPTSCIQPYSYLYIALLVTTLFSALHPACTNSVTRPLLNPQSNRPQSMRSLAINYYIPSSLDCDLWFSCLLLMEW